MLSRSDGRARVLHLIASGFHGGPERQCVEHLVRLGRHRFEGILASFLEGGRPSETLERAGAAGVRTAGIPMAGPLDLSALIRLVRLLRGEEVNLLCTHGYKSTILGWLAGVRLGLPVLAFSRGYTAETPKVAVYEWLERRVLGRVAGVVSVAEGQRVRLKSLGVRCRRSWVVHNAVSVRQPGDDALEALEKRRRLREEVGAGEGEALVVCAGRLSPEKGHRFLLEAIRELGGQSREACFLLCGEGRCRPALERLARRLGVERSCRFLGFRRDLPWILEAMDLLVLPSLTEGLPNVVLEAFAWAKPVVATAVGGVPELVEHGVSGLLVPPSDPRALARALQRCLSCPGLRASMGAAGCEKVRAEFSYEQQTERLESIYDETLHAARRLLGTC